ERQWVHDSIDGWDFCDAAVLVPEPSADDARRLSRPETLLTIDQIDRVDLAKVVGKREAQQIVDGRAERRA
ncbi:MAG: hypothetical protein GX543_03315, partial [Gordonia sp.]|nr:hypothetical protein [Gordonia sp. (in: high G+C Gram-positive bacteria)]